MASSEPKFPHFPGLPTELRLQIWALAIPSRVLPIGCTKGILTPSARRYAQRFSTTSPPPSLLHTCRESRSIALSLYSPYFRTPSSPQGIYASFAHDTVSFPDGTITYLGKEELEGIERMVLEVKDPGYFGYYNLGILRSMSGLKDLELRTANGVCYGWGVGDVASYILRDLRIEVLEWPDWKVPEIRIMQDGTGLELCVIRERGDLLPPEEE